MRVQMLRTERVVLDAINSKNYPVGWKGEVDDARALAWIERGSAKRIAGETAKPVELTEEEKSVLKVAAQQALAAAHAEAGETVDPETGEITEAEDGAPLDVVLADMTWGDLKELAKLKGVKYVGRKRALVEADLLALAK